MRKNGLILLFLLLLFFPSCKNEKKVPKEFITAPKEITNINFFLETSASMKGYLLGGAEFSKIIPNLLVEIENRIPAKNKNISINYVSDSVIKYSKTTREFIHDISTTNVAKNKSSEMHRIFEMVIAKTAPNDISLFVSDCILSYPDADVRKNREINKINADGELKSFIKDAFLKIKKRNICATLYGFNSKFYSTYYTYQNEKIYLQGEVRRPFYIWVVGDKELLQNFNKQLQEIETFKPQLIVDFGMFEKPIDKFSILFKTERIGKWSANNQEIDEIELSKTHPIKFALALDLSTLPKYAQEIQYLKKMVSPEFRDGVGKIIDIKTVSDIDMSKAAPHEKEFLEHASHVIIIEVSDMYKSSGTVVLRLPLKYSTEYINWSTPDDKNKNELDGKTFSFQHLVDGVREAYQNNNDYYINISIPLKK